MVSRVQIAYVICISTSSSLYEKTLFWDQRKTFLWVFSEGVSTFGAAHKLGWRFVPASSLYLPNVNQVVFALLAFHAYCRHGFDFLFLFAYDGHKRLGFRLNNFHYFSLLTVAWSLLGEAAFWANKRYCTIRFLRLKTHAASWAKLHKQKPLLIFPFQRNQHNIRIVNFGRTFSGRKKSFATLSSSIPQVNDTN